MDNNTRLKMLFHVHTRCSFDGIMSPARIVEFCKRRRISVLAITDHDSDAALDEAETIARASGITLIPAVEYSTNHGDIIGLFCRGHIARGSANNTMQIIHDRGGLVVLPHPFKGHRLNDIDLSKVDLIEVFNARCNAEANQKASQLAHELAKPSIVGDDAHLPWDLGRCDNTLALSPEDGGATEMAIRAALLRGSEHAVRGPSPFLSIPLSQMVKAMRQRRPRLFLRQIGVIIRHFGRRMLGKGAAS